jgi:hypothetical protein
VAPLINRDAYETGLFLKFPLPDILKVAPDRGAAEAMARLFERLGVTVDVVGFDELGDLPRPAVVEGFGFADNEVLFICNEGNTIVPSGAMRLMVVWKKTAQSRPAGGMTAKSQPIFGEKALPALAFIAGGPAIGGLANLMVNMKKAAAEAKRAREAAQRKAAVETSVADLYVSDGKTVSRMRLDQYELDYTGLGPQMRPEGPLNWRTMVDELRRRAPNMTINEAMVRQKPPPTTGKYLSVERTIEQASLKPYVIEYSAFVSVMLTWRLMRELGTAVEAIPVD